MIPNIIVFDLYFTKFKYMLISSNNTKYLNLICASKYLVIDRYWLIYICSLRSKQRNFKWNYRILIFWKSSPKLIGKFSIFLNMLRIDYYRPNFIMIISKVNQIVHVLVLTLNSRKLIICSKLIIDSNFIIYCTLCHILKYKVIFILRIINM